MALNSKQREALLANEWFGSLSEAIQEDVLSRARQRLLAQGKCLFKRGDPPDFFFCVLEGCIRVSGSSSEGREAVLSLYEPGTWFGEISMLDGLQRTHDAYAHTHTVLLQIGLGDFEDLLSRHVAFSRMFLRLECTRLRALAVGFESYSTQTLEQRLAWRLLALGTGFGVRTSEGLSINVHLSQELVAQLVGATRQRVNQLLKQWENEGLISQHYGHIVLRDKEALEAMARD